MRYFKLIDAISGLDFKPGRIFGMNDNNMVYTNKDNKCEFINAAILYSNKFKEIVPRFEEKDMVKVIQGGKDKYGRVIAVDPYNWQIGILFDDGTTKYFGMNYSLISRVTPYWFINSEGKYCKAFEEKTDSQVLNYRKSIGNYFKTKEDAKNSESKYDYKQLIDIINERLDGAHECRNNPNNFLSNDFWEGMIYTYEEILKYLNHE